MSSDTATTTQATARPAQAVTDELRRWIIEQAEAGCRPEDVLNAMKTAGWDEEVALDAMEETLRARLDELGPRKARVALPPGVPVPNPDHDDSKGPVIDIDGHPVRVLMTMAEPRVMVFGNLLTEAECDAMVALASPRLARSETVDNATGGSEVNAARTSDGMFFERGETPLIDKIERRLAALVRWPLVNGEGLQILRYRPGAEYKPHHDYFDPVHPGTPRILERGGQRVGTIVMYLNTPEGGGATTFPDVGLTVAPVKGNAVFFSYDKAHASTKTLHGGAPVTAGEKWVATKWMREGEFK
ncbi:MAG: 2OG-Fe(II) oxygenase [Rubrivivax sp.]|nr:2OG-Fe(II) oxygenase [Rubrivivax sp.]